MSIPFATIHLILVSTQYNRIFTYSLLIHGIFWIVLHYILIHSVYGIYILRINTYLKHISITYLTSPSCWNRKIWRARFSLLILIVPYHTSRSECHFDLLSYGDQFIKIEYLALIMSSLPNSVHFISTLWWSSVTQTIIFEYI